MQYDRSMKLKLLRLQANLTLEALGQATDLTRSYLSKLERGLYSPSVGAGLKLAKALGVSVEELFGEASATDSVTITRRSALRQLADGESRLVAGTVAGHSMVAFLLKPSQKVVRRNPTTHHMGEEILYVLSGAVTLQLASQTHELGAGDCVHFNSAVPHKITGIGGEPTEVLLVIHGEHVKKPAAP